MAVMNRDAQDWYDLASVYQAGAERVRGWQFNTDRLQEAEVLEAQADRCREIARERDGNPSVSHDHDHMHTGPDGDQLRHRHRHWHASGATDHDPDSQMTGVGGSLVPQHPHDRDPFAPPERLWPGPDRGSVA
jgi:hypothetical protein